MSASTDDAIASPVGRATLPPRAFLETLPAYEKKLATYSQDGNREILAAIDDWLRKR